MRKNFVSKCKEGCRSIVSRRSFIPNSIYDLQSLELEVAGMVQALTWNGLRQIEI